MDAKRMHISAYTYYAFALQQPDTVYTVIAINENCTTGFIEMISIALVGMNKNRFFIEKFSSLKIKLVH